MFEISMDEFDKDWWPLVSNVWTERNQSKRSNGDSSKVYTCRFAKSKPSSTRKEGIPAEKRRKTMIRPPNICSALIKISRIASLQVVRIERPEGGPDHTHSLRESDQLKRPQAIRMLVEAEAVKNYSPPAIASSVREYAEEELGLGGPVHALRTKEVSNIQLKIRGPLQAHLVGDVNLATDIQDCISFLQKEGYRVEHFNHSQRSTEGIVFAHPAQLEKLWRFGWLTLIDATHKTNKHDFRLFTLYIRDCYGCWNVGAHFFVTREDSDTVAAALKIVRQFERRWTPRYVLMDQSSIEAKGIMTVFPGLLAGEQECNVILCTVHVMRLWMKRIYHVKTREKMTLAMHKRTRIGCEELIQQAINTCPVQEVARYILRNCQKDTHRWALWARQHSPLLLQVTTTNPLESYHSELKRNTSYSFGLIGKEVIF
jgi:hypothetical protein